MYCCGAGAIARARHRWARGRMVYNAGAKSWDMGVGVVRRAKGVGGALSHGKWEGPIAGVYYGC
jgi:hypothetical protein